MFEDKAEANSRITEAKEEGLREQNGIDEQHTATMTALKKEHDKLVKKLNEMRTQNTKDETELQKINVSKFDALAGIYFQHDNEINAAEVTKAKTLEDFKEVDTDLKQISDEHDLLREEARKREEIAAIMERKNKEFTDKMDKLNIASAYIQAHWMGMLQRKERDKAMKGKKKKRKGGKK